MIFKKAFKGIWRPLKRFLTWVAQNDRTNKMWRNGILMIALMGTGVLLGHLFYYISVFRKPWNREIAGGAAILGLLVFTLIWAILMLVAFKFRTRETNYRIALDEAHETIDALNPHEFLTPFRMVCDQTRKTMDPSELNKFVKLVEKHHVELKTLGLLQDEHKELSDENWLSQMKAYRDTRLRELTAEIQIKGITICDLKREITGSEEL